MNIGIIDADLIERKKHRFPNLACMKLSGYYKSLNNNVNLIDQWEQATKKYDKIFISKVFTDTKVPDYIFDLPNIEYGGTGFYYDKAIPLPYEIEHFMPDYNLYDDWIEQNNIKEIEYYKDYSIGFLTRKCFRGCEFCVNKNYKKVELHSPLEEFVDKNKKYICLLDDNFLGYNKYQDILLQLQQTKKYFQFKQGLDERLLTEDRVKNLSKSKYKGDYIFAFDNIEDKNIIIEKLKIWRKYNQKTTKFYIFCGYDRNNKYDKDFFKQDIIDVFERIKILMSFKCLPYIMRHENYLKSPYRGLYINLARWCNQPNFFKKKSFREFCEVNGDSSSCLKYLKNFENLYNEIGKQYFDLKYENKKEEMEWD